MTNTISHNFWVSPTFYQLAQAQNVGPLDARTLLGTWAGKDDDGFNDAIDELRHVRLKKTSDGAVGDSAEGQLK